MKNTMKQFKITFPLTLLLYMVGILSALTLTSCGGDDSIDNGDSIDNPHRIFISSMLPSKINDYKVLTSTEGLVTKFVGKDEILSIGYNLDKHDADTPDIVLSQQGYYNETINFTIGDNGFVSYAERIRNDKITGIWIFTYDSEGHLICVESFQNTIHHRYDLTWENEDIVTVISDHGEDFTADINYTSDEVTTPIYNKGNIMLLEPVFRIDMDNAGWMQYAGLFGKATRHLPVGRHFTNSVGTEDKAFEIHLNEDGLLVYYDCHDDAYNFIW